MPRRPCEHHVALADRRTETEAKIITEIEAKTFTARSEAKMITLKRGQDIHGEVRGEGAQQPSAHSA